ncbi:unnamed protein product, partial [Rotaria sp. Silwood2]
NKHIDTCYLCQRDLYEQSKTTTTTTTQSYLSGDEQNLSEHNTTFDSSSLPPSPFVCDPYESYDWEC